jgi:magnesium transporter
MNFRHMPELTWSFGYPLAIGAILAVCVGLWGYFRKIGWL